MKDTDLIRTLRGIAKHLPSVNHQENRAIKEAADRLDELIQPAKLVTVEQMQGTRENEFIWIEKCGELVYCLEVVALCKSATHITEIEINTPTSYIELGMDEYGKTWRCWTSRPTEEQREGKPWQTTKATAPTA